MPDVEPTPAQPPAFVGASAYSARQAAQLGVPRGLVAYTPRFAAPAAQQETPISSAPGGEADPPAPVTTPTLGLGPRTRFRFQSHSAEAPVMPPSNLTTDPATSRRAGAVRKVAGVSVHLQWISFVAIAAAAGTLGCLFALAPGTDKTTAPDAGAAAEHRAWTPSDRQKLDAILAAEAAGHPREMRAKVDQLATTRPNLGGMRSLEARAAVAQRSFSEADVALVRASQEPDANTTETSLARALHLAKQRKLDDMRVWLTDAIAHDPTRAELYFQRAEVDRRLGRTQDALAGFEQARALAKGGRTPTPETINFRWRLCLIERGRETEIDTKAYQAAFAQHPPPADWMLIAAAIALQRHDTASAAQWMSSARAAMPWREYVERLDDYVFRNHIDDAALRELFPTPAARAQVHATSPPVLIDP